MHYKLPSASKKLYFLHLPPLLEQNLNVCTSENEGRYPFSTQNARCRCEMMLVTGEGGIERGGLAISHFALKKGLVSYETL